jgi:hypothetical protein
MHAPLRRFCIMMIPMGFSWGSTLYFLDVRINTEELSRLISILISHKCYYHFNGWSRRLEDVAIRGFIDRAHCHGLHSDQLESFSCENNFFGR